MKTKGVITTISAILICALPASVFAGEASSAFIASRVYQSAETVYALAGGEFDLDHDGKQDELVFGPGDYAPRELYAVEASNGGMIWNISMSFDGHYQHEIVPADLDNDGWTDDIVMAEFDIYGIDNDSNVLCMGARMIGQVMAENITSAWLETGFDGGRHMIRLDKIKALKKQ